jgi:hypothetical protein
MKARVSKSAVVQRIKRRLRQDGRRLCGCSPRWAGHDTLGDWYVADTEGIRETHVDLDSLARALGVLGEWEEIN